MPRWWDRLRGQPNSPASRLTVEERERRVESLLRLKAGNAQGSPLETQYTFDPGWETAPITIDEAEGKTSGGLLSEWTALRALIQPGDQLFEYWSPPDSWQHLAGRAGIVLMRDGRPVADIVTLMN